MHPARVSSLFGALALLLAGATGVTAETAPPAATAHLELQAPPECTSREELTARIMARSHRIRFTDDVDGGLKLRAAVTTTPRHGAVGELVIVGADGRSSTRRLTAPTCAEATDALALIIALMLDPSAVTTPAPPPAVVAPPPQPPRPVPPPPVAVPVPPRPRPVTSESRFGLGLAGEVLFGPSPEALPGIAVFGMAALDRRALWSPALILAWVHAFDSNLSELGQLAAFTLDAASLDACALRVRTTVVEARACGNALVGRLLAGGSETFEPKLVARPYAALGGALVVIAGPWHRLEVSGRFSAGASLVRDSFEFYPYFFHRTGAVTLAASVGVGVRFP